MGVGSKHNGDIVTRLIYFILMQINLYPLTFTVNFLDCTLHLTTQMCICDTNTHEEESWIHKRHFGTQLLFIFTKINGICINILDFRQSKFPSVMRRA